MIKEFEGKCELIKADCVMVDDDSLTNVKRRYHGVAYTHIQLIKDAKARGDKTLFILEDDCELADKTSWSKWLKIKNWLDNNMEQWEMFNGGIVSPGHIEKIVSIDDLQIIKSAAAAKKSAQDLFATGAGAGADSPGAGADNNFSPDPSAPHNNDSASGETTDPNNVAPSSGSSMIKPLLIIGALFLGAKAAKII
jgi:hypothetical protein